MAHLGIRLVRSAMLAGISASTLVCATAASAQVEPAADEATGSNDIIVTTRRIEERLQDVPIAVTAFSAEALERQNIDDLSDVAEKTVGFAFETFTGPLAQPVIRGQTNLRTTSPVQNVATSLNGIYIQRGYFVDQGLLDLERVEIIKGPQSALYGRNAFAGVISLQTRTPDLDELSGRVTGTIGTDSRYEFKAGINVPIAPGTFAIYAASGYSTFDGTWNNAHPLANAPGGFTRGKLGGWEKRAMQLGAKLKAGPVTAEAMYIRTVRAIEQNPAYTLSTAGLTYNFNSLNASPTTAGGVTQNRLFVGELQPTTQAIGTETRLPGLVVDPRSYGLRGPSEIWMGKVTLDTGGPVSLEYLYGHTQASIIARGSSARDPLSPTVVPSFIPGLPPTNFGTVFDASGTDSSFQSDSHEAKAIFELGSTINGFAGVNFTTTSDIESNASEFAPVNSLVEPNPASIFPVAPGNPIPTTVLFRRSTFLQRKESVFSAFGFLQWKPTDNLALTIEGRYTEEDQRATDLIAPDVGPGRPGAGFIAATSPSTQRKASFFTPRGSLTYKFDDNHNIYASVGRGYKSGGINGVAANYNRVVAVPSPITGQCTGTTISSVPVTVGQPVPSPAVVALGQCLRFDQQNAGTAGLSGLQQLYDAETNWTYEIGSKNRFFDGALTLNLAAFYTDWKNLQSNAVRLQPDGTAPTNFAAIVPSLIGNVGDVRVLGFEVEGNWRVSREFRIDFGAAYNEARYKQGTVSQRFGVSGNCNGTVCATVAQPGFAFPVLPIAGNQLERTPAFDALLGLNFDTEFSNGWKFYARADVTYQTKQFADEANLATVPSRTLVNASVGVTIDKFNVQLWTKNLFDKRYVTSALFLIGTAGAGSASYVPLLGEQRTVGLTVSSSF